MARAATVVIPTCRTEAQLQPVLSSLTSQALEHQVILIDNGASGLARLTGDHPNLEVVRPDHNLGFSRAVNLAATRADGETLVLLNDDCTCDPGFLEAITEALDPPRGIVMAAGVMRESRHPNRIDTAGIDMDRTLLPFDYLNGEPLSVLDGDVPDPIGPSGVAAAFDRATFLGVGGFDERLFAYYEDVDLVLRIAREGGRCSLVASALGTHEHSATLGSGSKRKNYLTGFGRGYLLRKWGVLNARLLLPVLGRELTTCLAQVLFDHNLTGTAGRVRGYLAGSKSEAYPGPLANGYDPGPRLRRRLMRRLRLRA